MSKVEDFRQWKKRHPDYPLTVHPAGQWAKKVRGKLFYFGSLDDPDAALEYWLREKDYLLAGMTPPDQQGSGITVKKLREAFLEDAQERLSRGEISPGYLQALRWTCNFLAGRIFDHERAASLTPEHFANLRQVIAAGRKPRTQKDLVRNIRAIFRWGVDMQKLDGPVNFGPRFKPPSVDVIERERVASGRTRFIDREIILALLAVAKPKMKAMILLGINCGFYSSDTASLPLNHLHLDGEIPFHDFPRAKNGRRRMAVLWPETVAAIESYLAGRPRTRRKQVFLTRDGRPYGSIIARKGLGNSFDRLLVKCGVPKPPGASLGSLRHTYGTVVDLVPDQKMIDLTMGHTNKSLQKRVYSQLNLNELKRLKVVADTVHRWLYEGVVENS